MKLKTQATTNVLRTVVQCSTRLRAQLYYGHSCSVAGSWNACLGYFVIPVGSSMFLVEMADSGPA